MLSSGASVQTYNKYAKMLQSYNYEKLYKYMYMYVHVYRVFDNFR
jgi:hypothetical protein